MIALTCPRFRPETLRLRLLQRGVRAMVGALTPALAPCGNLTASSDNLRDHYTDCAQRGDRKIPETGQRGRRRHACQSVSFPTRARISLNCGEILFLLTLQLLFLVYLDEITMRWPEPLWFMRQTKPRLQ